MKNPRSEDITELLAALVKASDDFGELKKAKRGVHNAAYTSLETIMDAVRKPLAENGLILMSESVVEQTGGESEFAPAYTSYRVITYLYHISGQFVSTSNEATTEQIMSGKGNQMNATQALGSMTTYFRRYNITALLNLTADNDDDGAASKATPKAKANKRNPKEAAQNAVDYMDKKIEGGDRDAILEGFSIMRDRKVYPKLVKDHFPDDFKRLEAVLKDLTADDEGGADVPHDTPPDDTTGGQESDLPIEDRLIGCQTLDELSDSMNSIRGEEGVDLKELARATKYVGIQIITEDLDKAGNAKEVSAYEASLPKEFVALKEVKELLVAKREEFTAEEVSDKPEAGDDELPI